jgi:hypothetical protein
VTDSRVGRWTTIAELGRGRLGPLFLARSEGGDLACVRQLDARALEQPGVRDMVVWACRGVAAVNHPGVIPVLDTVDAEGTLWIVTAYAPGPALKALLTPSSESGVRGWAPDPGSALAVLGDVADATLALHAHGLAHGAIAASAVVIGYDGLARLCDAALLAAMTRTPLDAGADARAWADLALTLSRAWVASGDAAAAIIARAAERAAPFDGRPGDLADAAAQLRRPASDDAARAALRGAAGEWAAQRAVAPPVTPPAPEGTATMYDFDDPATAAAGTPAGAAGGVAFSAAAVNAAPTAGGGATSPAPGGVAARTWEEHPAATQPIPSTVSTSGPVAGTPTVYDAPPLPAGTPTVYAAPAGTPTVFHDAPLPQGSPTVVHMQTGSPTIVDRPPTPGAAVPTVIDQSAPPTTPYRLGIPAPPVTPAPAGAGAPPQMPAYPGAAGQQPAPSFSGPQWFTAPAPAPQRRSGLPWLIMGALALAAVVAAGVVLLLSRNSSGPALTVTGVVAVAQPGSVGCDSDVHVSGTVTTNGGKGTLDYQWFRDGQPVTGDILHMPVDKDQTQVHLPDLTLTTNGKGTFTAKVVLTVITPAGSSPGTTTFKYAC